MVKSVDPMAPKPTPNISIVPPLVKARKQWYRGKHSGHWKEKARMGLGILGPRNSQVGQVSFSEYMIGVGLGAMGSTDFTKLLSLLSIAQRLEWRGQTHKDGGSNPSEVEILNP